MKESEARNRIFSLYRKHYIELKDHVSVSSTMGALPFYGWLEKNHPEVLAFEFEGQDRYQVIAGWFNNREFYSDL